VLLNRDVGFAGGGVGCDVVAPPDRFAIDMILSAMSGAMGSALETGASPAMFRKLRDHLVGALPKLHDGSNGHPLSRFLTHSADGQGPILERIYSWTSESQPRL
jgi:hypothetical protein